MASSRKHITCQSYLMPKIWRIVYISSLLSLSQASTIKHFPQRSNNESALLEWGHSAMIQAADAVVAQFGLQAWEEEFKLGIEAAPVLASPLYGCQPLKNSQQLKSQMVLMARGGCDFETKAKNAVESGAAALIVINDEKKPNHAFSMRRRKNKAMDSKEAADLFSVHIPCLMISLNSWEAISQDKPDSLRLYPGNDSPFIESVRDVMPSISIIHNFFNQEEVSYLLEATTRSHTANSTSDEPDITHQVESVVLYQNWLWGSEFLKSMQEKMAAVLDFPVNHFSPFKIIRILPSSNNIMLNEVLPNMQQLEKELVLTILVCLDNHSIASRRPELTFTDLPVMVHMVPGMAVVYEPIYVKPGEPNEDEFDYQPEVEHALQVQLSHSCLDNAVLQIYATESSISERHMEPILSWVFPNTSPRDPFSNRPGWMQQFLGAMIGVFGVQGGVEVFYQTMLLLLLALLVSLAYLLVWVVSLVWHRSNESTLASQNKKRN